MKGMWAALTGMTVAMLVVITGTAGAATVTIGSPLTSTYTNNPSGSVGTTAMVSGPNLTSPVDGTVINWRTQGFTGGPFRMRVLQLSAGDVALATGSGPPILLNGGRVDQPVSVPIQKGQLIGFDNSTSVDRADVVISSPTYFGAGWFPALQDGGPAQPSGPSGPIEFAYNATVRYCLVPGLKGKKLGAAKQALSAAACRLGTVKKKKGTKGRKAKFVRSQSVTPGTSLADGAAVAVKLGKKPKKKK